MLPSFAPFAMPRVNPSQNTRIILSSRSLESTALLCVPLCFHKIVDIVKRPGILSAIANSWSQNKRKKRILSASKSRGFLKIKRSVTKCQTNPHLVSVGLPIWTPKMPMIQTKMTIFREERMTTFQNPSLLLRKRLPYGDKARPKSSSRPAGQMTRRGWVIPIMNKNKTKKKTKTKTKKKTKTKTKQKQNKNKTKTKQKQNKNVLLKGLFFVTHFYFLSLIYKLRHSFLFFVTHFLIPREPA